MEAVRTLTESDKPAVRALWEDRFGDSSSFCDWFFAERYRPDTSVGLFDGARLLSCAQGAVMRLRVRGVSVPALMISGVSTQPGCEQRGYMHRVLGGLMRVARERGCALTFDKPAHLPTFFSLGHLPNTDTLHASVGEASAPPPPVAVPDFPALLDCYRASTRGYSACVERTIADFTLKYRDYASDGVRLVTIKKAGRVDGYAILLPAESGWYGEEVLARSPELYPALCALLPKCTEVKLPPDAPIPGDIRPQNVLGAANVSLLLSLVLHDPEPVFEITDPVLPENNGVFDGMGCPTARPPQYRMRAGELAQYVSGYRALDPCFPKEICYCVDEY